MRKSEHIRLLARALEVAHSGRVPLEGEETLVPIEDYLNPERFDKERERVFRHELNLVTLSSRVSEAGDFITAEVAGVEPW